MLAQKWLNGMVNEGLLNSTVNQTLNNMVIDEYLAILIDYRNLWFRATDDNSRTTERTGIRQ